MFRSESGQFAQPQHCVLRQAVGAAHGDEIATALDLPVRKMPVAEARGQGHRIGPVRARIGLAR